MPLLPAPYSYCPSLRQGAGRSYPFSPIAVDEVYSLILPDLELAPLLKQLTMEEGDTAIVARPSDGSDPDIEGAALLEPTEGAELGRDDANKSRAAHVLRLPLKDASLGPDTARERPQQGSKKSLQNCRKRKTEAE